MPSQPSPSSTSGLERSAIAQTMAMGNQSRCAACHRLLCSGQQFQFSNSVVALPSLAILYACDALCIGSFCLSLLDGAIRRADGLHDLVWHEYRLADSACALLFRDAHDSPPNFRQSTPIPLCASSAIATSTDLLASHPR